ncbi:CHC2 zinc finger domain-containing protein, partial [Photorhabdus sp. MH8.4]
ELQHLKAAVSLVAVVEQQGRQLFKRGKDYVLLCPFHQEKTPSMVLSPEKNLYHCFGCHAGGSVLDWVMKTEGLSLRHAVERLRGELGENPAMAPLVQPNEPAMLAEDEAGRQALLNRVVEFYHQTLLNAPEALAYLEKRRLNHPELVACFKPGLANRTLGYRLPASKYKAGSAIRTRLMAAGILRDNGHEHFRGSLVIPVIDMHGQIREIYGRKIGEDLRKNTPRHLYLPGAHGGVWNEPAMAASASLILCESLIDAMSFWVAGYRNVTAAYGVNGFTPDHWQALKQHQVRQVLIAFDNDPAGNDAAVKLAAELTATGIAVFRVVFPEGMDANGYLCQVAEPERAFGLLLDSAVSMQDAAEVQATTATERAALAEHQPVPVPETVSALAAGIAALPSMPNVVWETGANGEISLTLGTQQWGIRGLSQVKAGA